MELINRTRSWEIDSYSMPSPKVGPTRGNSLIKTYYNHPLSLIVRDKSLLTPSFFRVALASVQIPMNCSTHGRIIPKHSLLAGAAPAIVTSAKFSSRKKGLPGDWLSMSLHHHLSRRKFQAGFSLISESFLFWVGEDFCVPWTWQKVRLIFFYWPVGDLIFW